MSAATQLHPSMATPRTDMSLQVLFGKAFLVQLQRGDISLAKVFARAFLLRTPSVTSVDAA